MSLPNWPVEIQHHHTTADAPQTVYHVRKQFQKLEEQGVTCEINYPIYKNQRVTMWGLISQKMMPPTRTMRYCCAVCKERAGANRIVATGVRKEESVQRSDREVLEALGKKKQDRITLQKTKEESDDQISMEEVFLNNDNDPRRKMMEHCQIKGKIVCNPIIDWTTRDVWDFIHSEKLEVNPLYQCGFDRVGCIGCPLAGKVRYWEFKQFPKYERMYRRAFDRMLETRKQSGKETVWKTSDEVFRWWMDDKNLDGQMKLEV